VKMPAGRARWITAAVVAVLLVVNLALVLRSNDADPTGTTTTAPIQEAPSTFDGNSDGPDALAQPGDRDTSTDLRAVSRALKIYTTQDLDTLVMDCLEGRGDAQQDVADAYGEPVTDYLGCASGAVMAYAYDNGWSASAEAVRSLIESDRTAMNRCFPMLQTVGQRVVRQYIPRVVTAEAKTAPGLADVFDAMKQVGDLCAAGVAVGAIEHLSTVLPHPDQGPLWKGVASTCSSLGQQDAIDGCLLAVGQSLWRYTDAQDSPDKRVSQGRDLCQRISHPSLTLCGRGLAAAGQLT
jgi:hypothetical protein